MHRLLALLMMVVLSLPLTASAQKLALHATQPEVNLWNTRRVEGPYLDDWTRIINDANSFRSSPTAVWPGNQLNVIWDGSAVGANAASMNPNYYPCSSDATPYNGSTAQRCGDKMQRAAFVYLLTSDTTYLTPVKSFLLNQAAQSGTNFSNTSKWGTSYVYEDVDYLIGTYLHRLIYAYSYVRSTFTGGEQTTLDAWFLQAATYWDGMVTRRVRQWFPNYPTSFESSVSQGGSNCQDTHWNGNEVCLGMISFESKNNDFAVFSAMVGVQLNHTTLKTNAKTYWKSWLKYATFPDGTVYDQVRWIRFQTSPGSPGIGYSYAATTIGNMIAVADAFAREGDHELYNYSTSEGIWNTVGGPKSLDRIMRRLANMNSHAVDVYGSVDSTLPECERIDANVELPCPTRVVVHDMAVAQGNRFYQDPIIKGLYTRTPPGSYSGTGYDSYGGPHGTLPGARFLFGHLEGVGDPFTTPGDTLAPKAPTLLNVTTVDSSSQTLCVTRPIENTDDTTFTDFAGYNIDRCQNASCSLTAYRQIIEADLTVGAEDCWTEGALTQGTEYFWRVYARDVSGNPSDASNTDSDTTSTLAATEVLKLALDETTGTVADETAAHVSGPFDGTLYEGALVHSTPTDMWDTGQVNGGILCANDDNVEVAHHAALDLIGDMTVRIWFQLLSTTNVTTSPTTNAVVLTKQGASGTPYHISVIDSSGPKFRFYHTPMGMTFLNYTIPVDTTWRRVAITRNASASPPTVSLYINGQHQETISNVGSATASGTALRLCASFDRHIGRYANVGLDEVQLTAGVLSDTELLADAQVAPDPTPTGVFAQQTWCGKHIDSFETDTCRWTQPTPIPIVKGNEAIMRMSVGRTVDNSPLTEFAAYCRSPATSGTFFLLGDFCDETHPFCYGNDRRKDNGISTTAQLIAGANFAGGKFYKAFGARLDQFSIPAAQALEFEIAIRARSDIAVGTTVGCCMRLADGTEIDDCKATDYDNEAIGVVVVPRAYGG